MKEKKHQKHAKLARPDFGQFHRNEWGLIGTNCGAIQGMAADLTQILSEKYQLAYVDADHKNGDEDDESMGLNKLVYTDKINYHRLDWQGKMEVYQYRNLLNDADLVLVNANHFRAKRHLVFIDPKKEASLQRKLDRLDHVDAFILTEKGQEIPLFLKEHIGNWAEIPGFSIDEKEKLAAYLLQGMESLKPVLNGLILAGGKSSRMGKDKGNIIYHNKPHREHLADLIAPFCKETYISLRDAEALPDYNVIKDTFLGLGPKGAILSAFRQDPNAAWLVVACDYPLMNENTIRHLVDNRNTSKLATAFHSPHSEFPEPLITIWEPRSYPVLLQFLTQGYSCPRKVLINSDVHLLEPEQPEVFENVNHTSEYEHIIKQLKS